MPQPGRRDQAEGGHGDRLLPPDGSPRWIAATTTDAGDFRLMSRRSGDALLQLRERHGFMKGLSAWVGFPSRAVVRDCAPQAAGTTKWSYDRLFNLRSTE